jgi:hypothetical protein
MADMTCCGDFDQAFEDGVIVFRAAHEIDDGPLMNQVISDYYLRKGRAGGHSYYAINYCPFCGMPRSHATQGFGG